MHTTRIPKKSPGREKSRKSRRTWQNESACGLWEGKIWLQYTVLYFTVASSSSESSAQQQVFHCKSRKQGWSSVQRQVFHFKLRNQGCSSAQRQIFHCKLTSQDCSSVQRKVFHCKRRNRGCSFTRDWIDATAFRCFPHPTLSLASEQTLKDLEVSQGHQRGGEESGFG